MRYADDLRGGTRGLFLRLFARIGEAAEVSFDVSKQRNKLRREDWTVLPVHLAVAQRMVEKHHYAGGGANTGIVHGLVSRKAPVHVKGVAWWIPPTRTAAETVDS